MDGMQEQNRTDPARMYYDVYAESRNKPFEEVDRVALFVSTLILYEMHYDVNRMVSLFETARLYAGKEF